MSEQRFSDEALQDICANDLASNALARMLGQDLRDARRELAGLIDEHKFMVAMNREHIGERDEARRELAARTETCESAQYRALENGMALTRMTAERDAAIAERDKIAADLAPLHAIAQWVAPVDAWGKNICAWAADEIIALLAERDKITAERLEFAEALVRLDDGNTPYAVFARARKLAEGK